MEVRLIKASKRFVKASKKKTFSGEKSDDFGVERKG